MSHKEHTNPNMVPIDVVWNEAQHGPLLKGLEAEYPHTHVDDFGRLTLAILRHAQKGLTTNGEPEIVAWHIADYTRRELPRADAGYGGNDVDKYCLWAALINGALKADDVPTALDAAVAKTLEAQFRGQR